jgi:hypothetical protein
MRRSLFVLVLLALMLACVFMSSTQVVQAADYPYVANLKAFSPEADYMSLPGYLRFLVYERDGVWMTRGEAVAIVDTQIASASH